MYPGWDFGTEKGHEGKTSEVHSVESSYSNVPVLVS